MSLTAPMTPQHAQKVIAKKLQPRFADDQSNELGETLIRLGRLDPAQVDRVRAFQAKTGKPFGRSAVRLGMLAPRDLQFALGVQLGFLHETNEPVSIPAPLVVLRNPYSKEAEEFNQMRTRLITGPARDKLSLLSITAVDAKVEAAYVAANLAASFAQLGRHVVLIDADLRHSKLAKMFGEPGAPGVTDVVAGNARYADAVRATLVKGLDLLPAGASTRDPQSILGAKEFKDLLETARNSYEIVIVMATPFGCAADVEFVWAATQHVITVARKDHTRADTIKRMRSVLRGVGAEIIGAAMAA